MPEGPEIWRAADKIKEAIKDQEIKEIWFDYDHLQDFSETLQGRKIMNVEPRGKAIITRFEGDLNMYSHNQLYGKWIIRKKEGLPENNRTLRVRIQTDNATALLYSASDIELLNDQEVEEHSYIKKLGPDVVHPDISLKTVKARYEDDAFQNRKITTLLLDPGFLSGIGNYLRSEILFLAKVDPNNKLKECTPEQKECMAELSISLCRRSYKTKGITTSDDLVKALKEEGVPRSKYRHYVYGREGDPCYKCGKEIKVMKTGGRKVYYCEEEQINN